MPSAQEFVCEICGNKFKRYISRKKVGTFGRFCSRTCMLVWRREKFDYKQLMYKRILKDETHIPSDAGVLGYIAAFLDGEGSIIFVTHGKKRVYTYPRITFTNTNREIIVWIRNQFGGGGLYVHKMSKKNEKWSDCYYLQYEALLEVRSIARALIPYLHIKREAAEKALSLAEERVRKTGMLIAPMV